MNRLVIDKAGRVSPPRPVRASERIRKESGVWVYRSGNPATVSIRKLLENGREERHRSLVRHNK